MGTKRQISLSLLFTYLVFVCMSGPGLTEANNISAHYDIKPNFVADNIAIVSQKKSRCIMDCARSCQKANKDNACNAAVYDKRTGACNHTMATLNDVIYDETKPDYVILYPKRECESSSLPIVSNGYFEYLGESALLKCDPGYTYSQDNEMHYLNCDFKNTWTENYLSCVADDIKYWSGREFVTAFMSNCETEHAQTYIRLLIVESGLKKSSIAYSTVTVTSDYVGFSKTFNLNDFVEVVLPLSLVSNKTGESVGNTVRIVSDKPVNVYEMSSNQYSTGGTLLLPEVSWSKTYVVASTPYDDNESRMLIITKSEAIVDVFYPDGQIMTIVIPSESTYQIQRSGLSGARIDSDVPVAVLAGEPVANIPHPGNYSADNILTMMPPLEALDIAYITGRLKPREIFSLLITSIQEIGTPVQTDVTLLDPMTMIQETLTLQPAESAYRTYTAAEYIVIVSTNKVMVTQYGVSASVDNTQSGDVSMFVVPGLSQFVNGYKFVVPENYTSSVMLTFDLMDDNDPLNGMRFNGVNVDANLTVIWATSGYFGICYLDVQPGVNTLSHINSTLEFGAVLYGRQLYNEYAWILGMKFTEVDIAATNPPIVMIG